MALNDPKTAHKLFLLFNHRVTSDQEVDAKVSLGVSMIIEPPESLKALWQNVPPERDAITGYLLPVQAWLSEKAGPGDYLLVQGDFGATYLMVHFAFEIGMVPIYSTTERMAVENHKEDGIVELTHDFKHRRFRRYGG